MINFFLLLLFAINLSSILVYSYSNEFALIQNIVSNISQSDSVDIDSKCREQLQIWNDLIQYDGNSTGKFSLFMAFDSFGRRPSGLFTNKPLWLGDFNQCIKIKEQNWYGKYCHIETKPNITLYNGLFFYQKGVSSRNIIYYFNALFQVSDY